ncbi:DUF3052 domain-containing protein [Pseudolysobacter antarcticus]|uniref:DUF3052 domain-containing protein n=1 Tax=Pseudolysobacter antarcticus TaxID=2511995 RepID=A0A411HFP2_9GAMM|nr:DUF3052 domain-containing protein [Pseudolysobacter antarcticus]QBB69313.1 DUF3052 domain-containing protein [Pseudolysobacter antarcticus]
MNPAPAIGYSGTPLAKKLGIKEACQVFLIEPPDDFVDWLQPLPQGVIFVQPLSAETDMVIVFALHKTMLAQHLSRCRKVIRANAMIWACWPKKSSGVASDISEDIIREVALPIGLVDIKVCAISAIWSGLKLVIRKELR